MPIRRGPDSYPSPSFLIFILALGPAVDFLVTSSVAICSRSEMFFEGRRPKHTDLVAQSQVLKFEDSARPEQRMQGGEERRERNQHRRKEL
jgi:hypothetical protein